MSIPESTLFVTIGALIVASVVPSTAAAQDAVREGRPATVTSLKDPSEFDSILDTRARSAALFVEAGRVIESPRCMNCHPVGRVPTQGNDRHPHVPFMNAGEQGHGQSGLPCTTCHQAKNFDTQGAAIPSIPGHDHWALAPPSMSWQGKSLPEICAQIKDPSRNGARSLAQISEHMGTDSLVGWAWRPGYGRGPAPGTQAQFGALITAWIATGASCPK